MKKFLIALLLSMNTVYAGEPDELFKRVDDLAEAYFAGWADLATAKELCKKVFQYADAHNIEIWLEDDGHIFSVNKEHCETDKYGEQATKIAVFLAISAAEKIKNTKIEPHSEQEQLAMELAAEFKCARDSSLDSLRRQGYDTYSTQMHVKCSQMDRRCIVSIPIKKDTETSMYTACCMMTIEGTEMHTETYIDASGEHTEQTFKGIWGASVAWDDKTSDVPNLDDFGYDCKPKVE